MGEIYVTPRRCPRYRKATKLLELARRSVGEVSALEEDKWELQHLLDEYMRVRRTIDEADERIQSLLSQIPYADLVMSVGITAPATTAINAFGGDLCELPHGNQLLRRVC